MHFPGRLRGPSHALDLFHTPLKPSADTPVLSAGGLPAPSHTAPAVLFDWLVVARALAEALTLGHVDLLAKAVFFAQLNRVTLAKLAGYVDSVTVEDGSAVCRQGDAGDALYIVVRGVYSVLVGAPDGAAETRVATLSTGDVFGEIALLTGEPRSATVRAEGPGELLRLEQGRFLDLLHHEPTIAPTIIATLIRRLRAHDQALLQSAEAVSQSLEHELARLPPGRRRRVLEASVPEEPSPDVLQLLFGEDAESVAEDLRVLGVTPGRQADPRLRALRERYEQDVGTKQAGAFAQEAAARLAEARRWDAALAILVRSGPRAAFVATLGRALSDAPSPGGERTSRWVEALTDSEAAQDGELALARAAFHTERGDPAAAARVLQRALATALVSGNPTTGQRLTAAVAGLAARTAVQSVNRLETAPLLALARPQVLRSRQMLALAVAAGLILAAVVTGGEPRSVFVLLSGAAIVLWTGHVVPDFAVGLGLMAAWLLFGVTTPAQVARGFGSMNWVFVLAILGIAAGVARSGLLFRIGLLLVRRLPQSLPWQAGTLMATGLLLAPLLPSNQARVAMVQPLALAVAETNRLRDREPAAAVLGLAAWLGAGPPIFIFLNSSWLNLLAWGLLPDGSRAKFGWLPWFAATVPLAVFVSIAAFVTLFLLFRPGAISPPSRERMTVQLGVLGRPSRREWAIIAVLLLTLAGWLAAPVLGIEIGTVAVLGLLATAVTGNFDRRSFQELDWNFLFFYGIVLSISSVAMDLGLDRAAADTVGAWLHRIGVAPLLFVLAVGCLGLLMRLVLDTVQTALLLTLALIPVAPAVGVEPWLVVVTVLATNQIWFIPSQTPAYLTAYTASEGRLYSHAQARRLAVAYAAIILVGLALVLPYWWLLGLL